MNTFLYFLLAASLLFNLIAIIGVGMEDEKLLGTMGFFWMAIIAIGSVGYWIISNILGG